MSGRTNLSIDEELIARAIYLERMPDFDPDRFCFLVNQEEWDALKKIMHALERIQTAELPMPTKKTFIRAIEVRRRDS